MNVTALRLKERREARGLQQGQVSEYEDLSQSYLSNLERGVKEPSVWPLLARLAKRYHTSTDYLLGLTDDPEPREGIVLSGPGREILVYVRRLSERRQVELLQLAVAMAENQEEEQAQLEADLAMFDSLLDGIESVGGKRALAMALELLASSSGADVGPLIARLRDPKVEGGE